MYNMTELLNIAPVLPSADIARDVAWYKEKVGFDLYFENSMYAVMYRDSLVIHLQWHADTESDPLLGGSTVNLTPRHPYAPAKSKPY